MDYRWLIYALLSASAAALVAILGKRGMEGVDSTLATAVRSIVMTVFLTGVCTVMGLWGRLGSIGARPLMLIILSGVAGSLSWLFYFRALQLGRVSQVAPIDKLSMPLAVVLAVVLLGERPGAWNWLGIGMILVGGYMTALPPR